jgi:hypothetical protein
MGVQSSPDTENIQEPPANTPSTRSKFARCSHAAYSACCHTPNSHALVIVLAHLDGGPQEYPCSKRLTESSVQCLCPNCSERFQKVIYVVRDGRDVMYSYYKFRHGLGQNLRLTFSNFLEVRRHHYPGPKWHEHVESWLEHAREGHVEMLLVKYEDLLVNSTAALERMAAFIGMNASHEGLLWATAVSTADSMRKIEEQKGAGFFEKKYSGVKERRGTPGAHHIKQSY